MCGISQEARIRYIRSLADSIEMKRTRLANLRSNIAEQEIKAIRDGTDVQIDMSYRMMVSQRDYLVDSLAEDYVNLRRHAGALE